MRYTQTIEHSHVKRNEPTSQKRHGGTLNAYCEVEEVSLKSWVLHDSNYKTFWKKPNYKTIKRIGGRWRLAGGGGRDEPAEHSGDSETPL